MKPGLLAVAVLAYLAAVLCFRPHATPGPQLRDFEAYYAAGQTWNAGRDPYSRDIWKAERSLPGVDARRDEVLPFVNPPPLLPFLSVYARLPFATAVSAWSATLGLSLLALLATLLVLLGRARDPFAWIAAIAAALAFGPISSDFALGQFALFGAAAIAVASPGFARGAPVASAIATTFAGMAPTFAPALLAWSRNLRAVASQVGGLAAFALLWLLAAKFGRAPSLGAYLRLLHAHAQAEGLTIIQFTPAAIAHGFGATDALSDGIERAVAALSLLAAGTIAWLRRCDPPGVFCAFCALTPLVLGFFHEHDFALLLVPAVILTMRHLDGPGRMWALSGLLLVGVDWLGIAQRPDGALQTVLVAVALTAAILALMQTPRVLDFAPLIGASIAVLAIGAIARAHALPIWPDAMQAFVDAPSLSIAQTWHAEQAAAGMFAPNALAAGLRLVPLIGAALLAGLSALAPTTARDSKTPSSVPASTR